MYPLVHEPTEKDSQQIICSNLDRMTVFQSIEFQGSGKICWCKLCPDIILWETMVHAEIFNPGGKTFIQPQVGPPFLKINIHHIQYIIFNLLSDQCAYTIKIRLIKHPLSFSMIKWKKNQIIFYLGDAFFFNFVDYPYKYFPISFWPDSFSIDSITSSVHLPLWRGYQTTDERAHVPQLEQPTA